VGTARYSSVKCMYQADVKVRGVTCALSTRPRTKGMAPKPRAGSVLSKGGSGRLDVITSRIGCNDDVTAVLL
jgi:hypothetical protein